MTDDSKLAADYVGMERTEEELRSIADAFSEAIRDLDEAVRSHLKDWEGDARSAYQHNHDSWVRAAAAMHGSLSILHKQIAVIRRELKAADDRAAERWKRAR